MPPPERTILPYAFRRLAWSNFAAQLAEQISLAAVPIVAVVALGAGPGETGLLQTAQTLPFLLLAIPAGALADRLSKIRLLAGAEILRAAALAAILALALAGRLDFALLAMLGFIGATGTVTFSVTAPALVPALVTRDLFPLANGRIELARTTAFAAGPAVGGALVGWTGAPAAFGLAAVLSATAVALLASMAEVSGPRTAVRRHLFPDIREGAAFVFTHPLLKPAFAVQFIFNVAFFILQAAYVPYAVRTLGLAPSEVGMTLAAFGAGLVLGAFLAPRIMAALPLGTVIGIGPVTGFIAAMVMVLTIAFPSPFLAALSFFLMGAGPILWVVGTTTLRQTVTPSPLLGRVSAINVAAYGARPVGAAIGAVLGALYGAEVCILAATAGFLAQAILVLASPLARFRA